MVFPDLILLYGLAHTVVAVLALARAEPGRLPWGEVVDGVAEMCCALLLRIWVVPPFRAALGWTAWPIFGFAVVWAFARWAQMLWGLAEDDEAPAGSLIGALGLGLSSGARQVGAIAWHVAFVAPSLVCGGFVLFGFAEELARR